MNALRYTDSNDDGDPDNILEHLGLECIAWHGAVWHEMITPCNNQ